MVKVLVLTRYGRLGASSRLRSLQYLPWLFDAGLQVTEQHLLSDKFLAQRYQQGAYGALSLLRAYLNRLHSLMVSRRFDVVWIEKEALPWWPLWLELLLLRRVPYVLDYDDAIFHNYDLHPRSWVRGLLGKRIDGLMARAALVIGGNSYLAQRARDAGATWVEVVPTVIDLERYPSPIHTTQKNVEKMPNQFGLPRIVWIGSPPTVHYLQSLRDPLQHLAAKQQFILRVIGGGVVDMPGVQVEVMPWAEASEVKDISDCQVGVMPLLDSAWERGKCGYKLIQYMACGLPVVASNVGVNSEIVRHGENGFLATSTDEWVNSLYQLLQSPSLSQRMGAAGRNRVEDAFCLQKAAPRIAKLLSQVAERR